MTTTALSKTGERLLANAERVIENGLATFLKVGSALTEIRDGRLYRADYETFEAYCQGRWGFTSRRARQLIDAAEIGTVVPVANEAQARALASLVDDPDMMRAAYQEAEAQGPVTAESLSRAAKAQAEPPAGVDPETGEVKSSGEVETPKVPIPDAPPASPVPPKDPLLVLLADLSRQRAEVAKWLAFDKHDEAIAAMSAEQRADYRSFIKSVWDHASATLDSLDAPARLKAVR